ncbi:MAG: EAL domain-containing protein [Proteobacteria bacterium]|nr:EAL domain-containing protein [Pseudomonadota bacterium]
MRGERDRFVALAFCWADLLLELDSSETVVFAAGATQPLLGRSAEDLVGLALPELIVERDRSLVQALLGIARKHGRIENVAVRLQGARGTTPLLTFAGYRLEDLEGHFFLAFRMGAPGREEGAGRHLTRDAESGLYDAVAFTEVVSRHLQPGDKGGDDSLMTLLLLPDYDSFSARLDAESNRNLLTTFGACMRAHSVDGDAAARIGTDRWGLLHSPDLDVADLETQMHEFARDADPAGKGVRVESATVEVDTEEVRGEDLANGLVYAINRFRTAKGKDFTIKSLSTSISALVSAATKSVTAFKRVVADADFNIAFQPIIDVTTGDIHHYEALVRFHTEKRSQSSYEYIRFAEETGLIQDFDLAMVQKVLDWLSKAPRNKGYIVAVNVSGHSVASLAYVAALHTLLKDNTWVRGRLMFEITESARMEDLTVANRFIQGLRGEGYTVCLDDLGAGAANFEYLSALEVDVVKLDGSALRSAQTTRRGKAFLISLTNLCRDLDVLTVGEMVGDEKSLEFIRECGVQYAQGYLFGRPSTDIRSFEKTVPADLFPARRRSTRPIRGNTKGR